ncbi:RNA polymerase sigma factor [Sphingomonas faeni]|uniref:RNA polymerase sigma factor n=1 Tax=Sphingomonas faeni TaxID=185950 RepID=UPI003593F78C
MTASNSIHAARSDPLEAFVVSDYGCLLSFIRARGAGDDAEDILQELWMKARQTDTRTQTPGKIGEPKAFLRRMAINLIADNRRAGLHRGNRENGWVQCHGPFDGAFKTEPCAERMLIAREELHAVDRQLDRLSGGASVVFRRFRIDGATQKEIAVEKGITVSGVEKHLYRCDRALDKLREARAADRGS